VSDCINCISQFKPLKRKYYLLMISIFFSLTAGAILFFQFQSIIGMFFVFIACVCAVLQFTIKCPNCGRCIFFAKIPIIVLPGIPKKCRKCGARLQE